MRGAGREWWFSLVYNSVVTLIQLSLEFEFRYERLCFRLGG